MSKVRRKSQSYSAERQIAKPTSAREDNASLAQALSEIVGAPGSSASKLSQIETLLGRAKPSRRPKATKSPGTEHHPVRSMQAKLAGEFNHIGDGGQNSFAESILSHQTGAVDIENGLDSLLASSGVKSKRVRGEFVRAVGELAKRVASGRDVEVVLVGLKKIVTGPEADRLPLPAKAPKLFSQRPDKSQTIIDFLRDPEGWGPWTSRGLLSRPMLNKLDRPAYLALNNWLKNGDLPPDLEMPTISQAIDRIVAEGAIDAELLPRIGAAMAQRRRLRAPK